ncbi:tubulin epsilon and delta complex protein 1 isoform X2 [Callorhinchus milii]|uniref:tubulin epsilon and delta complex protein 1 isoform X2 n=1 Tax=Callorhinchus milii TaxID=7868 RepID=UPI001C3F69B3|nr:tubulin epsilon and delta complex protein 1 isoform X2 [Callorhinchus milii]
MKVRPVIAALCRVVASLGPGLATLTPELFRQAKLGREHVAAEFWKMLYCLLRQVCEDMSRVDTPPMVDQVEYVKAALAHYGYGLRDLYCLPADGSAGSRELLLAFSWLLQKINLLKQLMNVHRLRLGDETSLCTCRRADALDLAEEAVTRSRAWVDIRRLQCLHGKLCFRWRALHSAEHERCAALYKIHSYTRGCSTDLNTDHLSVMETRLIQDPKHGTEMLQLLELESSWLEAYLEWKQCEGIYWQWMMKVTERSRLGSEELELIKRDVEQKLTRVRATSERRGKHGNFRLVLQASPTVAGVRRSLPDARRGEGALTASDTIAQLKVTQTELRDQLQKARWLCKETLEEYAERLQGVICIPPMKRAANPADTGQSAPL